MNENLPYHSIYKLRQNSNSTVNIHTVNIRKDLRQNVLVLHELCKGSKST